MTTSKKTLSRPIEPIYSCTNPSCLRQSLESAPEGFVCASCRDTFLFLPGTNVPKFCSTSDTENEYSHHDSAEFHDNILRWMFDTFKTDEESLRDRLITRIGLRGGERILITGAGAGNDLPFLARALLGSGEIYAQDIAEEMLLTGASRHGNEIAESGIGLHFSVSDATDLPFGNSFFDAAFHFGGINVFSDIQLGMAEMNRVVKPGGKIVIGDEGVAPWLVDTEFGRMMVNNNALYGSVAPLSALPSEARGVKLSWELGNCFYVLEFEASNVPLDVNIDVPHLGRRGGSIRSRYFGRLEGIDPELRDRIYEEAEKRGVSRVDFLKSLLVESLERI